MTCSPFSHTRTSISTVERDADVIGGFKVAREPSGFAVSPSLELSKTLLTFRT